MDNFILKMTYTNCYLYEMLPIPIYIILPIPNVTYTKFYKYQMLPIPNVNYAKCDLCKMLRRQMLPIPNVTFTKC